MSAMTKKEMETASNEVQYPSNTPNELINIEVAGVDRKDYPDFSDAYIGYAEHSDGTPLTDEELCELDDLAQSMAFETLI